MRQSRNNHSVESKIDKIIKDGICFLDRCYTT